MTRHTIAATVRGITFRIRAEWSNPAAPVQIEAEDGYAWHDTGDTVGDWTPAEPDAPAITAGDFTSTAAAAAIAGVVLCHFDHPRWAEIPEAAIIARAIVED